MLHQSSLKGLRNVASLWTRNFSLGDQFRRIFGGKGRTTLGDAMAIFHNCKYQADKKTWFTKGLISNDFRSRHTLLMVHKRLVEEGSQGQSVQECLFDELWEDTSNRIRALGINELSVNARLSEVQGYSLKYCLELDHALRKELEAEVIDDIGGSLWRSVYSRKEEIPTDIVLEMARYVRREQLSLSEIPTEAIFEGRINWGPIPSFEKTKKGSGTESTHVLIDCDEGTQGIQPVTQEVASTPAAADSRAGDSTTTSTSSTKHAGVWMEAMAPGGRTYYWNTATRKTQWDKPKELK